MVPGEEEFPGRNLQLSPVTVWPNVKTTWSVKSFPAFLSRDRQRLSGDGRPVFRCHIRATFPLILHARFCFNRFSEADFDAPSQWLMAADACCRNPGDLHATVYLKAAELRRWSRFTSCSPEDDATQSDGNFRSIRRHGNIVSFSSGFYCGAAPAGILDQRFRGSVLQMTW